MSCLSHSIPWWIAALSLIGFAVLVFVGYVIGADRSLARPSRRHDDPSEETLP